MLFGGVGIVNLLRGLGWLFGRWMTMLLWWLLFVRWFERKSARIVETYDKSRIVPLHSFVVILQSQCEVVAVVHRSF